MPSSQTALDITNVTRATSVCSDGRLADTFRTRLFGLLFTRSLEADSGLLIRPSSGVHTFGMSFPIDIVALDRHARVVGVWEAVGPWRIRGLGRGTRSVLELRSGSARQAGIAVGDQLAIHPVAHAC